MNNAPIQNEKPGYVDIDEIKYPCILYFDCLISIRGKIRMNHQIMKKTKIWLDDLHERKQNFSANWYTLAKSTNLIWACYKIFYKLLLTLGGNTYKLDSSLHKLLIGPRTMQYNLNIYTIYVSCMEKQLTEIKQKNGCSTVPHDLDNISTVMIRTNTALENIMKMDISIPDPAVFRNFVPVRHDIW